MAEPSDDHKVWSYGSNPYNAHETGESGSYWMLLDGRRLYLRITDQRSFEVMIKKYRTLVAHDFFPDSERVKKAKYNLSRGKHTVIVQYSTGDKMKEEFHVY